MRHEEAPTAALVGRIPNHVCLSAHHAAVTFFTGYPLHIGRSWRRLIGEDG